MGQRTSMPLATLALLASRIKHCTDNTSSIRLQCRTCECANGLVSWQESLVLRPHRTGMPNNTSTCTTTSSSCSNYYSTTTTTSATHAHASSCSSSSPCSCHLNIKLPLRLQCWV